MGIPRIYSQIKKQSGGAPPSIVIFDMLMPHKGILRAVGLRRVRDAYSGGDAADCIPYVWLTWRDIGPQIDIFDTPGIQLGSNDLFGTLERFHAENLEIPIPDNYYLRAVVVPTNANENFILEAIVEE